jgi:hypothetical protein
MTPWRIRLSAALLVTTALVAVVPAPSEAAPVLMAFGASIVGGVASAAIAGATIVWSTILGNAVVAGVLAGVSYLLSPKPQGPTAQDITLNRITPVTSGLIVYGERTLGGSIIARSTTPSGGSGYAGILQGPFGEGFSGGKKHGRYHAILPLACHEIDGIVSAHIGETLVWTETQYLIDQAAATKPPGYWGHVTGTDFYQKFIMEFRLGTTGQTAIERYVHAADEWNTTARGKGVAYVYFEADFDQDVFPQGVEQIRVRIRGKKVYDPRTLTTAYSANPALHLRDYALTSELFGGIGWSAADIDDAAIIALANIADEDIDLAAGGTEKRYAFNGVLDTGVAPEVNLNRLSTSWGGWWTVDKGRLTVGGGAYETPTVTLTEDDLAGPLKVRARRPFEQQFNIVKAVYADPLEDHVPTDLPVLASTTYRDQDNGEELVRDLGELPGETSHARGQRLMKLALLKGRRQKMVELPCTLAAWGVMLGDNIKLTIDRRGWVEKAFEVVGVQRSIAPGAAQVSLSLIENGPDVFDWTTSEEEPRPAGGVPSLASPTERPQVDVPVAAESLYAPRGGGGVKTRVTLTTASENPFVETWQFSWRREEDSERIIRPITRTSEDVLDDFATGIFVFGARGTNRRGITGDWSDSSPIEIYGLNATPAAITGLSAAVVSGLITLRWDPHADLDVRQGGLIEVRHSADMNATWQTSTSIGKAVPGSATLTTLPAITGRYLLRATDSQGNPGPVTTIESTAPDFLLLTTLDTITESPTFPGVKTDCTVVSGVLQLDATKTTASYEFADSMDFGALMTVRITTILTPRVVERADQFDSIEMFDSIALFDGSEEAEGDVQVYYRASTVSPAVWGDWVEFDRTDISARLLQFKAELAADSDLYRTDILTLGVIAEGI